MPTDHPTPASGAETPTCPICHGDDVVEMGGLLWCRREGCPQMEGFARPTPPSDAGTSERETGTPRAAGTTCVRCGKTRAEHLNAMGERGGPWCSMTYPNIDSFAAAPAAEGPRHLNGVSFETFRDVAEGRPAAALPGAEAGTPKLADPTNELAVRQQIITELSARLADLTARHNELRVTMIAAADEAAALTSEVARLTQERDAARDAMVRYSDYYDREVEHNAALIAERRALTSEVRALQEDKARLDWLDGMARLREKPVFDVSKRLDGERFTVEFAGRHRHDWFHAPTLREAIDAARLASPSPTGAP